MDELLNTMLEETQPLPVDTAFIGDEESTDIVVQPPREEGLFGVEKIADLIDAAPQTVRNYAKDFDEFLEVRRSESGARLFTRRDAAIIKRIHEFKQEGMSKGEIKRYLERNRKTSPAVKRETQLIASAVSDQLQEKIQTFFEIGMKGISNQIGKMSSHLDTMEGSVKRQKEEIIKLQEQNKAMQEALMENDRLIKKLSLDAERRDAKNTDLLMDAKKSVDELTAASEEKEQRLSETNVSLETLLAESDRRNQSNHEQMILMIEQALNLSPTSGGDNKDLKELEEKYERARSALTRLAGELDEKNAIIRAIGKENPTAFNKAVSEAVEHTAAGQIITTPPPSSSDPINGLKSVASKQKKEPQNRMKQVQDALFNTFKLKKHA